MRARSFNCQIKNLSKADGLAGLALKVEGRYYKIGRWSEKYDHWGDWQRIRNDKQLRAALFAPGNDKHRLDLLRTNRIIPPSAKPKGKTGNAHDNLMSLLYGMYRRPDDVLRLDTPDGAVFYKNINGSDDGWRVSLDTDDKGKRRWLGLGKVRRDEFGNVTTQTDAIFVKVAALKVDDQVLREISRLGVDVESARKGIVGTKPRALPIVDKLDVEPTLDKKGKYKLGKSPYEEKNVWLTMHTHDDVALKIIKRSAFDEFGLPDAEQLLAGVSLKGQARCDSHRQCILPCLA